VRRPFPDGRYRDDAGEVRLLVRQMSWEAYLLLATEEIRLAGAGSPPVTRRLKAALLDLRSVAPPERVAPIDRQLELLSAATETALDDDRDVELALTPDGHGMGLSGNRA